jgi:flagellar hook-associated protein 2
MKLTVMDASDVVQTNNTGLAKLSFDPAAVAGGGNEFTQNTPAQDAHLTVDGLDIYRSANTISDAITGVSLSVVAAGTTTLTVAKDTTSAKSAMESFVTAYNELNTQLSTATAFNATTGVGSILTGDSGARSLQTSLRDMISQSRRTAGSNYSTLSDLGVALQRDGSLVFNSSKFAAAMAASTTNVGDLLNSKSLTSPGLAVRMSTTLDSLLSTSGIFSSRTEGITRSITDIGKQRTKLSDRLVTIEARYRKQYSALDTLIASMQQTSAYLTQQLATISANTSNA